MRTRKHIAEKARIVPTPFTFVCSACEKVEHRRTPALPEGWATEEMRDDIYAYCPDCAIDLPGHNQVGGEQ